MPGVVKQALLVLETITRACPALLAALILSARLKFITGDIKGSAASLQHVLDNIGELVLAQPKELMRPLVLSYSLHLL